MEKWINEYLGAFMYVYLKSNSNIYINISKDKTIAALKDINISSKEVLDNLIDIYFNLESQKTEKEKSALVIGVLCKMDELISTQKYFPVICFDKKSILNQDFEKLLKKLGDSFDTKDYLVITCMNKRWGDCRITCGSAYFRAIRGIVLNEGEYNTFLHTNEGAREIRFPLDEPINVITCHGSVNASYEYKLTEPYNFKNYGLYVEANNTQLIKSHIVKQGNRLMDDLIDHCLKESQEKKAHILVLPELCLSNEYYNEEDEKSLLKKLNKMKEALPDLKLVIAGSYYKMEQKDTGHKSICPIYIKDNEGFKLIDEYQKIIPCSEPYVKNLIEIMGQYEEGSEEKYDFVIEDIQTENNVTIVQTGDIIIGVAICRDVMDLLNPFNPIHKYNEYVDLMIVISDNQGDSNMFVGVAESLARWHNCATIYANAICTTDKNGKEDNYLEVSFAIYPNKNKKIASNTAVNGEITYSTSLLPENNKQNLGQYNPQNVGILNSSKGLNYRSITEEEKNNYCKFYSIPHETWE